jgi:hypothetical protein
VKNLRFIIISLCIGVVLISCSGPEKKDKKGQRPPVPPRTTFVSTMYDTRSFNRDAERLPPGYTGHNAELLYNAIRMRQEIVKSRPGENAEQHRSRIAGDIYKPLIGSLDFDSVYAFRITPAKRIYNSSRKILDLGCSLVPIFDKGAESAKKSFVVRYQPQLDNSYVITGKDGSKKLIEETKFVQYSIVPVDAAGAAAESRDTIPAAVTMTEEDIRKSEADVMFLVIGRLQSPYISFEEINKNPHPGSSGIYLGRYHYLHVHVIDIWVYDLTSGKILQKNVYKVQGPTFNVKDPK